MDLAYSTPIFSFKLSKFLISFTFTITIFSGDTDFEFQVDYKANF